MANYPKEFEELLQEYLTDGIITDKERRVLLRKAEQLGLDVEEIDLYIDAQEQKVNQSLNEAAAKLKGKSCPYCGSPVPQLADKCPSCSNHLTVQASEELQDIIDNLEEALVDFKSGENFSRNKANVERYLRKAKMYYGSNPKIKILIEEVHAETEKAEKAAKKAAKKAKGNFIQNHPCLFSFFLLIIVALIIGIVFEDGYGAGWIFSIIILGFGGMIIGVTSLNIDEKKEKKMEMELRYSKRR